MCRTIPKAALFIISLLSMPILLFALPEDREQSFKIVANSSTFNYKTGMDTYEGNIKVDQGTSHLTADRLVTQKNKQHKMILATATGINKRAEYTTIPRKGDAVLIAKANIIKFYPPLSTVILEENVVVTQKKNSFYGSRIVYNMKDQIVTAPASQKGGATILIEPEQFK
ncbi:MAG: lptA [Gammaproteobacteria bacterium]|jgi:lipopolysaccharide export system protein LptA|nr:lptA [Gammaproteobacteria bacterium]